MVVGIYQRPLVGGKWVSCGSQVGDRWEISGPYINDLRLLVGGDDCSAFCLCLHDTILSTHTVGIVIASTLKVKCA